MLAAAAAIGQSLHLQNRSQTLIVLHVTDEFSAVTDKLSKKNIPLTSSE